MEFGAAMYGRFINLRSKPGTKLKFHLKLTAKVGVEIVSVDVTDQKCPTSPPL